MSQRIEPVGPRAGVAPVELRALTPVERERRERRRRERAAKPAPRPSEPAQEGGGLDVRA